MFIFRKLRFNIDFLITALHPSEAMTTEAVIQSLYGKENTDTKSGLRKVNKYISDIRGRKRGLVNFPFWIFENLISPLMGLIPFFSLMDEAERNYFLKEYILRLPADRKKSMMPEVAELVYKLGTSIKALATFGHFTTKTGQESIQYVPPENRARFQQKNNYFPKTQMGRLEGLPSYAYAKIEDRLANKDIIYTKPRGLTIEEATYDYVIIGSGAAGAVMAYRLANAVPDPSKILLIERGKRQSPVNDMSDDELEMLAKLYKEGGLQQTKNFDMVILQGQALGGSTVINNAVCFKPTKAVQQLWQEEYGLDISDLEAEMDIIGEEINIHTLKEAAANPKVLEYFNEGVQQYNQQNTATPLTNYGRVKVNAIDEIGDGLWNLGNKRKRKLSMAQTYIKWAESLGIQVMESTNALRFFSATTDGSNKLKATEVLVQTRDKTFKKIKVGKKLVIAAGCLASSHLLMRSDIKKNVGTQLSCNYAFPFAFEYSKKINAYDGAQITAAAIDQHFSGKQLIYETYFNPPGAFALTLPFHFQTIQDIMDKYAYHLNFGVLVGSANSGKILPKPNPLDGRAFEWTLDPTDIPAIKKAFKTVIELGRWSGAEKVVIPLQPGLRIDLDKSPEAEIEEFYKILATYPLSRSEIIINSSHPQGGNLMANAKHIDKRVVDEEFKVENYENVYVVDASIFPTSLGVNPQWTIMGMSSLASKKVLE